MHNVSPQLTVGLKVYTSLLLQLILSLVSSIALKIFQLRSAVKGQRGDENRSLALATAMVEFHKHQCYFISAIEIAVIVLLRDPSSHDLTGARIYDLTLSVALAMSGLLPVVFTLMSIALYCRLSCYILVLSTVTVALSTTNLVMARNYWTNNGVAGYTRSGSQKGGSVTELCRTKASDLNDLDPGQFDFPALFVMWFFCIMVLLSCTVKHTWSILHKKAGLTLVCDDRKLFAKGSIWKRLLKRTFCRKVFLIIGSSLWLASFACQFYLYSLFYRSNIVSTTWTFGQIIAVSVWANSIVDFVYLDRSSYYKLVLTLVYCADELPRRERRRLKTQISSRTASVSDSIECSSSNWLVCSRQ